MGAYINEEFLRDFGVTDPKAIDLIDRAERIIDAYCTFYPMNDDGHRFPREENGELGIDADEGVPTNVKMAVAEQVLWMLDEGRPYVNKGGDDSIGSSSDGASKQKLRNNTPLLAPLAKLHLMSYLTRVGRFA